MDKLTFERANELFVLTEDGKLLNRISRARVPAGSEAGSIKSGGYRRVKADYREYCAHNVVWLLATGEWPDPQLDHINGIRDDNRLCNLREATPAQNSQNRAVNSNSKSGFVGVHWNKHAKKWRATIGLNGAHKLLGYFADPEEAAAAYAAAKAELHTFQPVSRPT